MLYIFCPHCGETISIRTAKKSVEYETGICDHCKKIKKVVHDNDWRKKGR